MDDSPLSLALILLRNDGSSRMSRPNRSIHSCSLAGPAFKVIFVSQACSPRRATSIHLFQHDFLLPLCLPAARVPASNTLPCNCIMTQCCLRITISIHYKPLICVNRVINRSWFGSHLRPFTNRPFFLEFHFHVFNPPWWTIREGEGTGGRGNLSSGSSQYAPLNHTKPYIYLPCGQYVSR